MRFRSDTFRSVLDPPQKGHRRKAHGLPEGPYRPQTVACLVGEQCERDAFVMFSGAGDCFHGTLRDAGTEEAFDEIHHLSVTKLDSYLHLRPEAGDKTHLFKLRTPQFTYSQGRGGRFGCFRGPKAPRKDPERQEEHDEKC